MQSQDNIKQLILSSGSTWISESTAIKSGITHESLSKAVYQGYLIEENGFYTTIAYDQTEKKISELLFKLNMSKGICEIPTSSIIALTRNFEREEGVSLHQKQIDAIVNTVNNSFSILIGGPGTGKSTTVKAIVYVIKKLFPRIKIAMAAPTGKAAKRLSEITKYSASTVHRQLKIGFDTDEPTQIDEDMLIIDESSFLDEELFLKVLKSLASGKKLLLIGDSNQLPSVGPGAVLRDLIRSGYFTTTLLTKTFRQNNASVLYQNIQRINEGNNNLEEGNDFNLYCMWEEADYKEKAKLLKELYVKKINYYGIENVALLLPYRKKGLCTNIISNYIQPYINPQKTGYKHTNSLDHNTIIFRENDSVMQNSNRPECVNGETGKVKKISPNGVLVSFIDSEVLYRSSKDLDSLSLSYAISVNKSQGSEFPCIIMGLFDEHQNLFSKNLLYTGISRGKQEIDFVYNQNALNESLKICADDLRETRLVNKLNTMRVRYRNAYGI